MDTNKTGQLIAQIRKELGMTQKQLAEKLNISDRTVSKWERGAGFPDISMLEPLADALGLNIIELLRGERVTEDERKNLDDVTVREALQVLGKHGRLEAGYVLKTVRILLSMFLPLITILSILILCLFQPVEVYVSSESWERVNVWTTDLEIFDLIEPEKLEALAQEINRASYCKTVFRFDGGMPNGLIADISVMDDGGKSIMRIELCNNTVYISTADFRAMELSDSLNSYLREVLEEHQD